MGWSVEKPARSGVRAGFFLRHVRTDAKALLWSRRDADTIRGMYPAGIKKSLIGQALFGLHQEEIKGRTASM